MVDHLMEAVREGRITLELDRTVKEVLGDGKGVTGLELASTKGEADKTVDVEGVFIAIGHRPNTSLFEGKLELDRGYIVTAGTRSPAATATSVPGVFAAGDVQDQTYLRRHGLHGGARRPALPGKPTVTSIKVNPFGFITNASHQQLRRPQAGQQGPQGRGQGPRGGRKEASCRGSPQACRSEPVALNLGTGEDKEPESQMSDLLDASVFLETEDGRMMHRKGVSPDIPRKLYRGEWPVEAAIDLHGMRVDEAREAVARFILENHMSGRRCLRIVHGVGYGSKGQGVLRDMVRRWLKQRPEVMAFVQCPPNDGDEGAVRVLVTQQKRD